jgi:hypothetical protein
MRRVKRLGRKAVQFRSLLVRVFTSRGLKQLFLTYLRGKIESR